MRSLCCTLAFLAAVASGGAHAQTGPLTEQSVSVPTGSIAGRSEVAVKIYLPAEAPQAVIVFLHGVGGDETVLASLEGPAAMADVVRAHPEARPTALLAVRGEETGWDDTRDGSTDWSKFLDQDLPEWLAARYPSIKPDRIALLGTSAGAAKALVLGLRGPDRFHCIAGHSPAIQPADPADLPAWARSWDGWAPVYGLPIDPVLWREKNPLYLAANQPVDDLKRLSLYVDVGVDDHLGFQVTTAAFSTALAARGVPHVFALRPGGHGSAFTRANLKHSMAFLTECLSSTAS